MISVSQLAQEFENGLNEMLDYENLSFRLWSSVGERAKSLRQGNDMFSFINGNISVSASSITANLLVMGVNQLTVEFDVPIDPPKTSSKQTAEELQRIRDGQYWFVQKITGILSDYFQRYRTLEMTDESGLSYAVGIVAGVAIPQGVELNAWRGNTLPVSVYIEANIVQGGIVSLDVGVELDGRPLPFQSFTPDRTGVLSPDVYSGDDVSKILTTSSAFAAEVSIPTNTVYPSSASAVEYLLYGSQNEAHFLKIKWGRAENADSKIYLVGFSRATGGMQGVTIASVTFRIAEIREDIEMINIPKGFTVGYFTLASSTVSELSVSVGSDCLLYVAGKAYEAKSGVSLTVPLSPKDIVYDESSDGYRVYLIASESVTVTAEGYSFEVA